MSQNPNIILRKSGIVLMYFLLSVSAYFAAYAQQAELDPSFNGTGTLWFSDYSFRASAVQPDNSVVVAFFNPSVQQSPKLVRFNRGGSIDSTFGSGGIAAVSGLRNIYAVYIQSDRKFTPMVTLKDLVAVFLGILNSSR